MSRKWNIVNRIVRCKCGATLAFLDDEYRLQPPEGSQASLEGRGMAALKWRLQVWNFMHSEDFVNAGSCLNCQTFHRFNRKDHEVIQSNIRKNANLPDKTILVSEPTFDRTMLTKGFLFDAELERSGTLEKPQKP